MKVKIVEIEDTGRTKNFNQFKVMYKRHFWTKWEPVFREKIFDWEPDEPAIVSWVVATEIATEIVRRYGGKILL